MTIRNVTAKADMTLEVQADDGRTGIFDVRPYLDYEAFRALGAPDEFRRVVNGGYYVEWPCGADLSADTIEARWQLLASPLAR